MKATLAVLVAIAATGVATLALRVGDADSVSTPQRDDSAPAEGPLNLLLVVMDTVRADHLSSYGYPIRTTPRLDELAADARRWTRMMSTAPWTLPAHASLFTGLYPFQHGAHTFRVETPQSNIWRLHEENLTLAEHLRASGYRTAAFTANVAYTHKGSGLEQGFEVYHVKREPAAELTRRALTYLGQSDARPFFVFLNFMDAHRPYHAVERPGLLPRPVQPDRGELLDRLLLAVARGDPPNAALQQAVIDQYDTAVAHVDEGLGVLFARMKQLGLWERTVVCVTSDHGEYFGEHGLVEHSKDVYQEALHVPFILRTPAGPRGVVEERLASLADAPRWLLDAIGRPAKEPGGGFAPRPGDRPILAENYYTRTKDLFNSPWGDRFWRIRRCIFEGDFKYIDSSDGRHELYDLSADPREQRNLASLDTARAASLSARLKAFMAEAPRLTAPRQPVQMDPRQRRDLEDLGYLQPGGDESASPPPGSRPAKQRPMR